MFHLVSRGVEILNKRQKIKFLQVVHEEQETCSKVYEDQNFVYIDQRLAFLSRSCVDHLKKRGFTEEQISTEPYLHLRYDRTDCSLACGPKSNPSNEALSSSGLAAGDFLTTFTDKYRTEFGFVINDRPVIVDDIRVRGVATTGIHKASTLSQATGPPVPVTVMQNQSIFLYKIILKTY